MQKVLTFPHAAAHPSAATGEATSASQAILERSGHTFIGSVLFLDIVEYSKKPVSEQLQVKDRFNAYLSESISPVPARDRIILDTGDGAAVNFLGDPEDALFVAMKLIGLFASSPAQEPSLEVRIGINLGPVRLMRDINGQPNIIGDGINVAQRVMSFAQPGQVLVSRSYHEVVTRLSQEYQPLFSYQGSRTDKHVREHEIYQVSAPVAAVLELAARRQGERTERLPAAPAPSRSKSWLLSSGLAWGFLSVGAAALTAAVFFSRDSGESVPPPRPAENRATAAAPALAVAEKPVEASVPVPPTAGPAPVAAQEPAAAAADPEPEPELVKPPSRPVRETTPPLRTADPKVAVASSLPVLRERAPEPPPAAAEAKPEAAKEIKPEQEASKPATLPTQYRAANGPTALVMLAISPWGEVYVDGKRAGVTPPMAELELAPGKHRIEIRNGALKPYLTDVDLGPNETTRIKHKFLQGG